MTLAAVGISNHARHEFVPAGDIEHAFGQVPGMGGGERIEAFLDPAKIGIRNARKDANTEIKKLEKDGTSEDVCKTAEEEIQKLTDAFIRKAEDHLVHKEAEIMKV